MGGNVVASWAVHGRTEGRGRQEQLMSNGSLQLKVGHGEERAERDSAKPSHGSRAGHVKEESTVGRRAQVCKATKLGIMVLSHQ